MSNNSFQEERKSHWQSYETKDRNDIKQVQNQEFYTSPDPVISRIKTGDYDRRTGNESLRTNKNGHYLWTVAAETSKAFCSFDDSEPQRPKLAAAID